MLDLEFLVWGVTNPNGFFQTGGEWHGKEELDLRGRLDPKFQPVRPGGRLPGDVRPAGILSAATPGPGVKEFPSHTPAPQFFKEMH